MDDHFDTSGVFEISKFDISKLACSSGVPIIRMFGLTAVIGKDFSLSGFYFSYLTLVKNIFKM